MCAGLALACVALAASRGARSVRPATARSAAAVDAIVPPDRARPAAAADALVPPDRVHHAHASIAQDCAAKMPLHATVSFELAASAMRDYVAADVAVEYYPTAGASALPALWSAPVVVNASGGWAGEIVIARLRAAAEYEAVLWVRPRAPGGGGGEGLAAAPRRTVAAAFVSCGVGWERVDARAFAVVRGAPSWEMATFIVEWVLGDVEDDDGAPGGDDDMDDLFWNDAATRSDDTKTLEGLVAIDAEGFVVWCYHLQQIEVWDFLPGGDVVMLAGSDGNDEVDALVTTEPVSGGATRTWQPTSHLQQVTPLGALADALVTQCTGDPTNYNGLTHECRVDATTPAHAVLSTRALVKHYPGTLAEFMPETHDGETTTAVYDYWFGSEIVRWNRADGRVEPLYDLFDFANPRDDMFAYNWDLNGAVGCSGGPQVDGPEYHHVSSVAAGNDANILVASRELATVWSFAHDGGGVQWVLSSRLRSDFRFEKRADEFYEPHDVRQLPNGDLTMIDDGSSRPGCFQDSTALCFSRAICYRFDRVRRVVEVVWQFAFPLQPNAAPWRAVMGADVYNNCGGSVTRLANGGYMVAFTSMAFAKTLMGPRDDGDDGGSPPPRSSYLFEIDVDDEDDASAAARNHTSAGGGAADDESAADDDDAAVLAAPTPGPTAADACARLPKGECESSAACLWKGNIEKCFASKSTSASAADAPARRLEDGPAAANRSYSSAAAAAATNSSNSTGADDDYYSPRDHAPRRQPRVKATIEIPIPRLRVGDQLGYRVLPWKSVLGETPTSPFGKNATTGARNTTNGDDDDDRDDIAGTRAPTSAPTSAPSSTSAPSPRPTWPHHPILKPTSERAADTPQPTTHQECDDMTEMGACKESGQCMWKASTSRCFSAPAT